MAVNEVHILTYDELAERQRQREAERKRTERDRAEVRRETKPKNAFLVLFDLPTGLTSQAEPDKHSYPAWQTFTLVIFVTLAFYCVSKPRRLHAILLLLEELMTRFSSPAKSPYVFPRCNRDEENHGRCG